MRRWIVIALLASVTGAAAQQPPTPYEQALGAKLMAEINSELTCSTDLISARNQVADLNRQIDDLKKQLAAKTQPTEPPK
jgi:xanthine dehydrogenase molybdopterin-binding subunit B